MNTIFKHLLTWLLCGSLLLLTFAACSDDTPVTPPDNPSGGGEDANTEWVAVSCGSRPSTPPCPTTAMT